MADFYVDHGCALYPSAYMSVPTGAGSFPQEGDGLAYGGGATPAVSVATMDFTAATAAAGATFGVHGATLTCVASGATTVQFNAGAGATLAANLATAINAATAAVTTADGNVTSPYLKALVWASASGAVLTVYSRIASTNLNQTYNASCVLICGATANWTAPPATSSFSGGVSGPWATFFNPAALTANISAAVGAAGTYGGVVATAMGAVADGDKIHVRTKRAAVNLSVTYPASSLSVVTRAKGTVAVPLYIIFDNGVKWVLDAGVFAISMDGSQFANRFFLAGGAKQVWQGTRLTDTTCSLRLEILNVPVTANYGVSFGVNNSNGLEVVGLEISGAAGAAINNTNANYAYVGLYGSNNNTLSRDAPGVLLRDCVVKSKSKQSFFIPTSNGASYPGYLKLENCLYDATGLTIASDYAIVAVISLGAGRFEAVGCRWVGFPAAANQSGFQAYSGYSMSFRLQDCTFDNIKVSGGTPNGGLVGVAEGVGVNNELLRSISISSSIGIRPFVFENSRRSFAWVDSAAPTTAGSTLPDGVTRFSIRTAVTTEVGKVSLGTPVKFPRMAKHNSLASGTRTAKLRLLVDNNIRTSLGARDPYKSEMWVEIGYISSVDGSFKYVSTRALPTDANAVLSAGVGTDWSALAYDVNGVTHNYTAYEISVSCPNMATLTEVGLVFCQGVQSASVDNLVFLDPEWSLI